MTAVKKNDASNYDVAGGLAKLLATENIRVEFRPGVPTAYFDIKNRVLVSPVWQGISVELRDMILVHETGHALDTPYDGWKKAIKDIARKHHKDKTIALKAEQAVQHMLNVVEDPRIDKRQKRRFPGAKRDYVVGLGELHQRDFFGIKGKDVNTLGFPDRMNIYFKGGHAMNIKFSKEEQALIKRVEDVETFEDVVKITDDLYAYARSQNQYDMATQKGGTLVLEDADEDDDDDDLDEGDIDYDQFDEVIDNRTGKGKKKKNGKGQNADQGESSEAGNDDGDENKNGQGKGGTDGDEDVGEKQQQGQSGSKNRQFSQPQKSNQKVSPGQGAGGGGQVNVPDDYIPQVMTEAAAEQNLKNFVLDIDANYIYLTTPEVNLNKIVDDFSVVIPAMENSKNMIDRDASVTKRKEDAHMALFTKWRQEENDTISFMVKEFEMRKAADMHSRIQIAKTGVLDTNKLHGYRYNDDIFRRVATIPEGKNHGFVMILDWSGSMYNDLQHTMKQLFSLVLFCKRVQIPFEVYLFRTGTSRDHGFGQTGKDTLKFGPFRLRNILSSRMNTGMLNRAMRIMWYQAIWHCSSDMMESTPLNQSLLVLHEIVNNFQKKNRVQIVSTIIMTDGASDPGIGYGDRYGYTPKKGGNKFFIRDHVTGRVYPLTSDPAAMYYQLTTVYVKMLKERTNANLVGFHLTSSSSHLSTGCSVEVDSTYMNSREAEQCWNNNKFIPVKTAGYDEYYIVSNRQDKKEKNELNISSGMTKMAATKAFIQFSAKKAVNRVLLSRFVTMIANLNKKMKE